MKAIEVEETLSTGEVVIRIAVVPDEAYEDNFSIQETLEEETDLEPSSRIIVWEM
jgi:hypothetical protein